MIRIFLFITSRSTRNRMARRLARLRQPRYVAGLVIGLVYFYFFVFRNQMRSGRTPLSAEPEFAAVLPFVVSFGALAGWALTLLAWVWPSSGPPIKFSGPEVQFLYTAPVTRRQLINYKLLRSQFGVLFGVFIAMVFSGGLTAAARGRWSFAVGGWLLFSTFRLHTIVIGLTRDSLKAGVRNVPWRTWVPPVLMAAISLVLIGVGLVEVPRLWAAGELGEGVVRLATTGISGLALWPFRTILSPILAPSGQAFVVAALPALALLALNYVWVLESDAALEDAAAAAEKKQTEGQRALPAPTARKAPFRLSPSGRPELAILWKNLILLGRYASPRMAFRLLLPVVVLSIAMSASAKVTALAPLGLVMTGFLTLLGPYMMRNDMRHDLPRLALLKLWPVSGATIVAGEVLAPLVVLTLLVWTAIGVTLALSAGFAEAGLTWANRAALAAVAALVAPSLIAAQLVIQNGAVVLFPGWIPTGGQRPKGIEAMGQQMLMMAGTLITLAIGLVPAAAIAGLLAFLLWAVAGMVGLVPAAAVFSMVLAAELGAAVVLLGRVVERTDPTQVEAED